MAVQTCMCLLDVVKRNKYIVVIFWSIMVPGLLAMHSFRCMIMHVPTQLRCYMTFISAGFRTGHTGHVPRGLHKKGPPQKYTLKKYLGWMSYYLSYFASYVIITIFLLKSIDKMAYNQSKTIASLENRS